MICGEIPPSEHAQVWDANSFKKKMPKYHYNCIEVCLSLSDDLALLKLHLANLMEALLQVHVIIWKGQFTKLTIFKFLPSMSFLYDSTRSTRSVFHGTIGTDQKGAKVQWSVFCGKVTQRGKKRHEKDFDFLPLLFFCPAPQIRKRKFQARKVLQPYHKISCLE